METIILVADYPYPFRQSGTDRYGCAWIASDFEPLEDGFPEHAMPDLAYPQCEICGEPMESGYVCLDGGNEVCAEHIEFAPAWLVAKLAAETTESMDAHNALVHARSLIGSALIAFGAKHAPNKYLGWTIPKGDN